MSLHSRALIVCAWVALLCSAGEAQARANGIAATGCNGCHSGGKSPEVTLTADVLAPDPGETVVLTATIEAVNGSVGGLYVRASAGAFSVISGQGTKLLTFADVVHASPKGASGGVVTFQVRWTAPAQPGGVDFDVWALSGNGSNTSAGDGAGYTRMSLAYGCAGSTYYRDFDGDGFGAQSSGTTVNCAVPAGYSERTDDCNDNDEGVFPGQTESCNRKDDDCDGVVDQGLPMSTFFTDADGDGFGTLSGPTMTGCGPVKGFAATSDDCDDADAMRHPGAFETCNHVDDDCDGRIDDGARVTCGVGMCARYGPSCLQDLCTPGAPEPETCNWLDDDCDGVVDNDACPSGEVCVEGACVAGPAEAPSVKPEPSTGCSAAPTGWTLMALAICVAGLSRRRRRG